MPQLADGYSTTITLALAPATLPLSLKLWSKTVTPFGFDGGGAIPITTMEDVYYRTMAPKQLVTLTEMDFTAAYDPAAFSPITGAASYINLNGLVTCNFPDGSSLSLYAFLSSIKPQEDTEGSQPLVSCTIVPTMNNGSNGVNHLGKRFFAIGAEIPPVYAPGP